jgi:hypothetical protein
MRTAHFLNVRNDFKRHNLLRDLPGAVSNKTSETACTDGETPR